MPADTRLWHPFADMHAVRGASSSSPAARAPTSGTRTAGGYLDGTASLWCVNVGHGRTEIADAGVAQMRELASYQTLRRLRQPPGARSRRAPRRPGAARRPAHLPRLRRRRRDRHRGQARPPLLRRRSARPSARTSISRCAGLPRHPRPRDVDRRHPGQPRGRRPAGPRRVDRPLRLARGARGRDRARGRRARRRGLRRAGHRRRRRAPAAARLHRGRRRAVRAHGRALRRATRSSPPSAAWARGSASSAGTCAPTCSRFAKGVTSGYLPLGGVVVERQGRRAVLGGRRRWFRHGPTYSGHPTVLRGGDGQPRHHRARGTARPRARARGRDRAAPAAPWPTTRSWARSAPASARWRRSPSPARRWPRHPTCRRALFAALRERGVLLRPLGRRRGASRRRWSSPASRSSTSPRSRARRWRRWRAMCLPRWGS